MDIKAVLKGIDLEDTINTLSSHYNISEDQLSAISSSLFPTLTNALQNSLSDPTLMENLVKAGSQIDFSAIKDNTSSLWTAENKNIGSNLLATILGGEHKFSQTIANLSNRTGLTYETISEFLPSLATLIVGSFLKKGAGLSSLVSTIFSNTSVGENADASLQGMLGRASELDRDGDGSLFDDLRELKGKFFG